MEAASSEVCGKGSTVMVFLACSSVTSCRICSRRSSAQWQASAGAGPKEAAAAAARLLGLQRVPVLVVAPQPEARHLVVLVVADHQVVCPRAQHVVVVCLLRDWRCCLNAAGPEQVP